jgi:chaperonin cofactor prefoldin
MGDSLKQRLFDLGYGTGSKTPSEALTYIEELEGERDEAMMTGHDLAKIEYRDLVSDLEAKLAKATDRIEELEERHKELLERVKDLEYDRASAQTLPICELPKF